MHTGKIKAAERGASGAQASAVLHVRDTPPVHSSPATPVRVAEADLPQLPVILKGLMDHPDRPVAAKQVRATPISNPGTSPQHANRDRHVNQKAVRS